MKTHEFLSLLNEHPTKTLKFEYQPNSFVRADYHITEIKNVTVDAIDCGAKTDFWKETIIQLWEDPTETKAAAPMSSKKALAILNKVDAIKPMEREVEVKFEYSNPYFHMSQLFVNDFEINQSEINIKLGTEQTDCKAKDTCIAPAQASQNSCAPESGCC